MPFTCSICGEESARICARCTKDACDNHLCEKCGRCSDCCECEITLADTNHTSARAVVESVHARPAAAAEPPAVAEPAEIAEPAEDAALEPMDEAVSPFEPEPDPEPPRPEPGPDPFPDDEPEGPVEP